MEIKSINSKGSFEILENKKELAQVHYQTFFSSECETIFDENKILIKPKDILQSKFDIYKNEIDIGDIVFTWRGEMIIQLNEYEKETWIVKAKGLWNYRFEVTNEKNDLVMVLKPKSNIKSLKYNYDVEFVDSAKDKNKLIELLIYSCFASNLYKTKQDNLEI